MQTTESLWDASLTWVLKFGGAGGTGLVVEVTEHGNLGKVEVVRARNEFLKVKRGLGEW